MEEPGGLQSVVLHFSQVLLGEGRRGGLHGGGGRWRFFRVQELRLRRPAQAAGFGLRMKGQKGGREGLEGEGCPVEDRWTSKSNCGASGRAEGAADLLVHKRSSEPRILLSPGAVTICSDFGAPQSKISHCFHCFPIYLP